MLKDLIKMARKLDSMGLNREANVIDSLIKKIAGDFDSAAYIAGRIEPESSGPTSFDSAAYIAGRIEPESSGPTSGEEMETLTGLGFSPLNERENEAIDLLMPNPGEYNYNNGCYIVIPHKYPRIDPMIYLRQPGKNNRTYSGHNQDELAKIISRFLDYGPNPYRPNGSLPVPGSGKLSG